MICGRHGKKIRKHRGKERNSETYVGFIAILFHSSAFPRLVSFLSFLTDQSTNQLILQLIVQVQVFISKSNRQPDGSYPPEREGWPDQVPSSDFWFGFWFWCAKGKTEGKEGERKKEKEKSKKQEARSKKQEGESRKQGGKGESKKQKAAAVLKAKRCKSGCDAVQWVSEFRCSRDFRWSCWSRLSREFRCGCMFLFFWVLFVFRVFCFSKCTPVSRESLWLVQWSEFVTFVVVIGVEDVCPFFLLFVHFWFFCFSKCSVASREERKGLQKRRVASCDDAKNDESN